MSVVEQIKGWRDEASESLQPRAKGQVEAYDRVLALLGEDPDEGLELWPEMEKRLREPGPLYRMVKNEDVLAEVEGWMHRAGIHKTNKRLRPGDIVGGSIRGRGGRDYVPVTILVLQRGSDV